MRQFTIPFVFEGSSYEASVIEIGGLDHIQYAVSPKDGKLAERFKTVIIKKENDSPDYHYNISESRNGAQFMESLVQGLKTFLGT
jgi:hypothetical protein